MPDCYTRYAAAQQAPAMLIRRLPTRPADIPPAAVQRAIPAAAYAPRRKRDAMITYLPRDVTPARVINQTRQPAAIQGPRCGNRSMTVKRADTAIIDVYALPSYDATMMLAFTLHDTARAAFRATSVVIRAFASRTAVHARGAGRGQRCAYVRAPRGAA